MKIRLLLGQGDKMIKVVCSNSDDQDRIAEENFRKIQPYLDQGYGYVKACMTAGIARNRSITRYKWFKDIVKVGEANGYPARQVVRKELKW